MTEGKKPDKHYEYAYDMIGHEGQGAKLGNVKTCRFLAQLFQSHTASFLFGHLLFWSKHFTKTESRKMDTATGFFSQPLNIIERMLAIPVKEQTKAIGILARFGLLEYRRGGQRLQALFRIDEDWAKRFIAMDKFEGTAIKRHSPKKLPSGHGTVLKGWKGKHVTVDDIRRYLVTSADLDWAFIGPNFER